AERARASAVWKQALEGGWLHSSCLFEALEIPGCLVVLNIAHVEPHSFTFGTHASGESIFFWIIGVLASGGASWYGRSTQFLELPAAFLPPGGIQRLDRRLVIQFQGGHDLDPPGDLVQLSPDRGRQLP